MNSRTTDSVATSEWGEFLDLWGPQPASALRKKDVRACNADDGVTLHRLPRGIAWFRRGQCDPNTGGQIPVSAEVQERG